MKYQVVVVDRDRNKKVRTVAVTDNEDAARAASRAERAEMSARMGWELDEVEEWLYKSLDVLEREFWDGKEEEEPLEPEEEDEYERRKEELIKAAEEWEREIFEKYSKFEVLVLHHTCNDPQECTCHPVAYFYA